MTLETFPHVDTIRTQEADVSPLEVRERAQHEYNQACQQASEDDIAFRASQTEMLRCQAIAAESHRLRMEAMERLVKANEALRGSGISPFERHEIAQKLQARAIFYDQIQGVELEAS
jgi:hypothetical protein